MAHNPTMLTILLAMTALAEEPTAPTTAVQTTPEPATEAVATPLPDIEAEAIKGKCERPQVSKRVRRATPGADQHYAGGFTIAADGSVTGFEKRILFANGEWMDQKEAWAQGDDCVVFWNVTGTKAPVTNCESCDFGLHFEANVDYDKSTCKKRITIDGNHFRGAYDIDTKDDGTIEVFFSNSGNRLARGYHRGDAFNWLTDHQCQWF